MIRVSILVWNRSLAAKSWWLGAGTSYVLISYFTWLFSVLGSIALQTVVVQLILTLECC